VSRKSLYDINYCLMGCGKVLAHVVESTWFVLEDLSLSPMYVNYVLYGLLLFCFGNVIVNGE